MLSQVDSLFIAAGNCIKCNNINQFIDILFEIYDNHLTCNCAINKLSTEYKIGLYNKVKLLPDDQNNYEINLTKAFVFLINDMHTEAFIYLTQSLKLKPNCHLTLLLRSTIETSINPKQINDLKSAILIKPTSYNYYLFIKLGLYKNLIGTSTGLDSVDINRVFACLYNSLGYYFQISSSYSNAIKVNINNEFFMRYTDELYIGYDSPDPNYYLLVDGFKNIIDYEYALECLENGYKVNSDNPNYLFAIGIANYKLKKFELAINFYNKYLDLSKQVDTVIKFKTAAIDKLYNELSSKAIEEYNSKNYTQSLDLFDRMLKYYSRLKYFDLVHYFYCKILIKENNYIIGEDNSLYQHLYSLRKTYEYNQASNSFESENEKNIGNLKIYNSDDILKVGRYKQMKVIDVLNVNPKYILWCIINRIDFALCPDLLLYPKINVYYIYIEALKINISKCLLIENISYEEYEERERLENINSTDDYYTNYNYYKSLNDGLGGEMGAYWNID